MVTVGSAVLGTCSSGIVVGEDRTNFYVVAFGGEYASGPLRLDVAAKNSRSLTEFRTPTPGMIASLEAAYKSAPTESLRQKSADAYAALSSFIKGGMKGLNMAKKEDTALTSAKKVIADQIAAKEKAAKNAPIPKPTKAAAKPAPKAAAKPAPKAAAKPAPKAAEKEAPKTARVGRKSNWDTAKHKVTDLADGVSRGAVKVFIDFAKSKGTFLYADLLAKFAKEDDFDEARTKRYFAWCRAKGIFAEV